MTDGPGSLEEQTEEFGQEMAGLLSATLPGLPETPLEYITKAGGTRSVIRPVGRPERLPLYIGGKSLATMEVSVSCQLDSYGQWLAVERSSFGLNAAIDKTPIARIDYRRDMHTAPAAHVQVYGHRGALSHLLSQASHKAPHDMGALHLPVGGARFRPCLEDFIQFLIAECGFDARRLWRSHVRAGRELWRRRQAAAVVRDLPEDAAAVLRRLGYQVAPPDPLPGDPSDKVLHNW